MTEKELSLHFPSLEKGLIDELLKVADVKTVQEGDVLMRTGQNIRSALLVLDGLVKIYREDDQGNEFFMYYINSGKACAISLVCALGQETSGLMAKAVTPATVLSIPVHYVDEWMGKYKSWAQFAVSSYRERFDELLQTIDHIAFRNMDERLLFYLKRHQEKLNSNIIPISFTEIAHELNSSREVISRLMKKLSDRGIVKLHRSHIEVINLEKLLS
ncbi:CRP/FNR family transcriptional regulator, anaerobic regulatory protein [Cnuella takakiae]|uniref:CRP/FNR family transcriptional regulator, anaerobic regulatory protein n=1 Tax=Cnuella takakiae TaxID=1302690 RepID=A0A1M4SFV5_9BACT|nr:Crp/Fnr family transcriptional regulator [Cnuella takakiae]OLY94494.1 Crp/Fnr family transcriptional regulator [Cnuella takakiae]SHE31052.1 CRP/FNR family transcriptional regulator, anaerobic regulatory protein [Cnuella takakiae]